jgi:type IV pilus assembly protein PilA
VPQTPKGRQGDDGFTLIELLVAIVIIGILAGIAIPVFLRQRQKAADAAAKSDIYSVALEIETYSGDIGGGYTPVSPAALIQDGLSVKVSSSTVVYLIQHTGNGFCLAAFNSNGSSLPSNQASFQGLSNNVIFWWDSQAGGLQPRATPISNYTGCPVTTGLGSDAGTTRWP